MVITNDVSVEVTVPAVAEHVSLVRHAIADVLDDTAVPEGSVVDLLLALDAMCSVIIQCSDESRPLKCECMVGDTHVRLRVTGQLIDDLELRRRGYPWRLLGSTVDGLTVATHDDGSVQVSGHKPHRSAD